MRLQTHCLLCLLFTLGLFHLVYKVTYIESINFYEVTVQTVQTGCKGWRATDWCTIKGKRLPHLDVPCNQHPPQGTAGYCLCEAMLTTAWVGCARHHAFTCDQECALLSHDRSAGKPLPRLMTCPRTNSSTPTLTVATKHSYVALGGARQGIQPGMDRLQQQPIPGSISMAGQRLDDDLGLTSNQPEQHAKANNLQLSTSESNFQPGEENFQQLQQQPVPGSVPTSRKAEIHGYTKQLWDELSSLIRLSGHDESLLHMPPTREENKDWVDDGVKLDQGTVNELQSSIKRFRSMAPSEPPPGLFQGRGIVTIAGGFHYMTSAWISLHLLRRTGSSLMVEMWFPVVELPTPQLEAELSSLGVIVRAFDQRDLDQSGFLLKSVAIALSGFQEVLFLDADAFPLMTPEVLFDSPEYGETGALFWQDFWDSSAAPQAQTILSIPTSAQRSESLQRSHDTGQIVVDKRRHWPGIVLSLHLNYYHEVYYELLTSFMGKGDKETFVYAMLAMGESVHTVKHPPQPLGTERASCSNKGLTKMVCERRFACNTMLQSSPSNGSQIMFMHSNLDKFSLAMPDSFSDYTRRWLVMPTAGGAFATRGHPRSTAFPQLILSSLHFDVEKFVYYTLRSFRCAPWFPEYYRMRMRKGDRITQEEFEGMHEMVNGMELLDWWRAGLSGPYIQTLQRSWSDDIKHVWNGRLKRMWRRCNYAYKKRGKGS